MLKHVSYLQVQLAKNRHSIRSPDGVRQRDPQPDLYVRAMGLFVQSLAACYLQKRAFDQKRSQYRGRAFEEAADAQTLEIVANLQAGFEVYLDFCVEAGAITKTERDELADRCWAALQETAQPQAEHQAEIAPTRRFSPSCVLWCHPAGLI